MSRRLVLLLGFVGLTTVAVDGCKGGDGGGADGGDGGSCTVGTAGCSCTGGGACDPGLECMSGLCVNPGGACTPGTAGCNCAGGNTCVGDLVCMDGFCGGGGGDGGDDGSGDDGGDDGGEPADCTVPSPYGVSGSLVTDVASVAFDGVTAEVHHKQDIDEYEDGCIRAMRFTFTHGTGCILTVDAADIVDAAGRMRVNTIAFSADSQCPNFADTDEGDYAGSGTAITGSHVVMSTTHTPDKNASQSCFNASFEVVLQGTLTAAGSKILTVTDDDTLLVTGSFESTAADGSCPIECVYDADCGAGGVCQNNTCINGCVQDSDCNVGEICVAMDCTPGCRVDADCDADEECSGNTCVPSGCVADSECPAGQICLASNCTPGCRYDGDCPPGQVCNANVCESTGGVEEYGSCPGPDGTQCNAGEVCWYDDMSGIPEPTVCGRPCTYASDCPIPTSGTATPACVSGSSGTFCVLDCYSGTCPTGMTCSTAYQICLWP